MDIGDVCDIGDNTVIRLCDIPKTLALKFQGVARYQLIGAVEIKSRVTRNTRNNSEFTRIGHYTAICRRSDDTFVRCDDLGRDILKAKKLLPRDEFKPGMFIYFLQTYSKD